MKIKILQIYYSEETLRKIDTSFLPLENLKNQRPDWREYWPIRNYLYKENLKDDTLYGFFSPKFYEKTGIKGSDAISFATEFSNDADLINFSPYFDLAAFYQNIFEQATVTHKNITPKIINSCNEFFPDMKISDLVTNSQNTIFCNYFIAKKEFWIEWFCICEKIFFLAEDKYSNLYNDLNTPLNHGSEDVHYKVFLIERIATLLAIKNRLKIFKIKQSTMSSYSGALFKSDLHHDQLMQLDALKIAYSETLDAHHMHLFSQLRQAMI
jgi:hypothetical protein